MCRFGWPCTEFQSGGEGGLLIAVSLRSHHTAQAALGPRGSTGPADELADGFLLMPLQVWR